MNRISLNRNQLKYLVIVAMLIDHIAWAFVPMASLPGQVMHFIGRLTGPTMAYFIAEGYVYTRNVKKYALRLGIFALLSWAPFVLFEFGRLPVGIEDGKVIGMGAFYLAARDVTVTVIPAFGVLYTLLLGLLAIWLWDKGKCPKWCKVIGVIVLCILSLFGDWPIFDVLYSLFFFCYRKDAKAWWTAYTITSCVVLLIGLQSVPVWAGLFHAGVFLVPLLLRFCYNGESGSRKPVHKWFFYVFYPAHLLLIGLLSGV